MPSPGKTSIYLQLISTLQKVLTTGAGKKQPQALAGAHGWGGGHQLGPRGVLTLGPAQTGCVATASPFLGDALRCWDLESTESLPSHYFAFLLYLNPQHCLTILSKVPTPLLSLFLSSHFSLLFNIVLYTCVFGQCSLQQPGES